MSIFTSFGSCELLPLVKALIFMMASNNANDSMDKKVDKLGGRLVLSLVNLFRSQGDQNRMFLHS